MIKKVGILNVQGLPAMHGAYEQTTAMFVEYVKKSNPEIQFFVSTRLDLKKEHYFSENVTRIFVRRFNKLGVLLYGLIAFLKMYFLGCRVFYVFGLSITHFFPLMRLMGCKIICNTDGFEWRREKWGRIARIHWRICEFLVVRFANILVFDSKVILRYYRLFHNVSGPVILYGSEKFNLKKEENTENLKSNYFVVVMRMEPENNILSIVEGFTKSNSNKDLRLIGPSTKFFEDKVIPIIDADKRITWMGPIYNRKELYLLRSKAFAYIHGHSVGGTNPTLVEACVIGKPLIVFDTSFSRLVVRENAVFFKDSESLSKIMNDLNYSYPVDPPILGSEYDWEVISKQYLDLL